MVYVSVNSRPGFRVLRQTTLAVSSALLLLAGTLATGTLFASDGGPDHEDAVDDGALQTPTDLSAPLIIRDATTSNIISNGPNAQVIKNLDVVGRGERNVGDATTDIWVHDQYAYTGTFAAPCGGDPEAGIWIWDVHNANKPKYVNIIPSPVGSRSNDVRVDTLNSGTILVHSNESCAGGDGGFEIYNVGDPMNPIALASVRINDPNPLTPSIFGPITDVGVHNLWLFSQGDKDYVGVTTETAYGNFHIYDITDPTMPKLDSFWGAEESLDPGVVASGDFGRNFDAAIWLTDGFGTSANRFLHDVTISADGTQAYLANWDAGLVLLDISDTTDPKLISIAIDPVNGSLDGEVNSHSVWPSEDGTIVVEGEEDFNAWDALVPPSGRFSFDNPISGVLVSTNAGAEFMDAPFGTLTLTAISVAIDSGTQYDANELGQNAFPLGDSSVSGTYVYIGRACDIDLPLENSLAEGDIAVALRGACTFTEKSINAANAGAVAIVIANNNPSTPWSGLRIWDYSDPVDPILASTFNTECSASTEPSAQCAANGTYSVHNVLVESKGKKTYAYVSWYWDGMIVLDVSDPYAPVEVARYLDTSGPNDGLANDFWGIHKEAGSPFFYGSDRNGGLYAFKLKGSGSGK